MKVLKIIGNVLISIVTIICMLFIVICFTAFFQTRVLNMPYPNIFGKTIFIIQSGSMEPTIDVGDDVLVNISASDINVDDIIVYKDLTSDVLVCHRVIKFDGDQIICQGDNNNAPDKDVNSSQVVGKVQKIIPKVGLEQTLLRKPWAVIILVDILIIYIIISLFQRSNKKEDTEEEKNTDTKETVDVNSKENIK